MHRLLAAVLCLSFVVANAAPWTRGLPTNENHFPIGVWLQNPRHAAKYKAAGINLYVGLWRGPTAEQLSALEQAQMQLICAQNKFALSNRENPIIVGWMHGDEPDNAQSLGTGKGYGPPIKPEVIQAGYAKIRAADPSRPVLLNLGQGVAYDNYIGRGVRRNRMEDYPEYVKGCDIASFDIYPVVHDRPEVTGKLEYVARGVERLVRWSGGEKRVWNCIECTHISTPDRKATPGQVRSEVWMALISGSQGLIYFVHQFKPTSNEAALLSDPEMLQAVTQINRQIHDLAPVLNTPTATNIVTVTSSEPDVPIASMAKVRGATYVFTVNLRNKAARGTFNLRIPANGTTAEVIGESREIAITGKTFSDEFKPYEVHLYKVRVNGVEK